MNLSLKGALVCAAIVLATVSARAENAERIVSIGGAVTEILYALGKGDIAEPAIELEFMQDCPIRAVEFHKNEVSCAFLRLYSIIL